MQKRHGVGILTMGLATALLSASFANNTLFNNDKLVLLGTVTVKLNSVSPGATVQINYNGNNLTVLAGAYNLTTTAPQNQAFCVDLDHFIHLNQSYTYELWLAYGRIGALLSQKDSFISGSDLNNKAAGFQIALWEVAHDHSLNNPISLTGNKFKYTHNATIAGYADGLLSTTAGQAGYYYYLRSIDQNKAQDLAMVPEPASLLAIATGFVGLIVRRRRK